MRLALLIACVGYASAAQVSVASFGAIGDGVHDDRPAIQQAIDSLQGGGTVTIPAGQFRITPLADKTKFITLKPRITIQLATGAELKVDDHAAPYDAIIYSTDCTGCKITGHGIINSNIENNPITSIAEIIAHPRIEIAVFGGSDILFDGITIKNSSAVNSIDVNGSGVNQVTVQNCRFENMGDDPRHVAHDASAIYMHAIQAKIYRNILSAAYRGAPGQAAAIETHGSFIKVHSNQIRDFAIGMNVTGVFDSDSIFSTAVSNTIIGALIGIQLWSHTLGPHTSGYGISHFVIADNSITINQVNYAGLPGSRLTGGVLINSGGDLPVRDLSVIGNTIIFDPEVVSIPRDQGSAGVGWWASNLAEVAENWQIAYNYIRNAPLAAVRLSSILRDVKIEHNFIFDAAQSLDGGIPSTFKVPVFIAERGLSSGISIASNSFFDSMPTTRIQYAMAFYGTAGQPKISLCDNALSITGTNQKAFIWPVFTDGATPATAMLWNQCN